MARPRKEATKSLPAGVYYSRSRGKTYWYYQYRKGQADAGPRITMPDPATGIGFWQSYSAAVAKSNGSIPKRKGSFSKLIEEFQGSHKWKEEFGEGHQRNVGSLLRIVDDRWGDLLVQDLTVPAVQALLDSMAKTPAQANNMKRALASMIKWSIPRGWRADKPCRDVEMFESGEEYEPWPSELIEVAYAKLPPELWWGVAIAYYTGQRQGDCLNMQWSHIRGNKIAVKQEKTDVRLLIPIHRDLAPIIAQIPRRSTHICTGQRGKPWTASGFRSSWQKIVRGVKARPERWIKAEEGIPELAKYVFHGLRKSAVCKLLEVGCTRGGDQRHHRSKLGHGRALRQAGEQGKVGRGGDLEVGARNRAAERHRNMSFHNI